MWSLVCPAAQPPLPMQIIVSAPAYSRQARAQTTQASTTTPARRSQSRASRSASGRSQRRRSKPRRRRVGRGNSDARRSPPRPSGRRVSVGLTPLTTCVPEPLRGDRAHEPRLPPLTFAHAYAQRLSRAQTGAHKSSGCLRAMRVHAPLCSAPSEMHIAARVCAVSTVLHGCRGKRTGSAVVWRRRGQRRACCC